MDKAPLVTDEIEAGKAFINRLNAFAPVKAAAWLRDAEDGERYLYVALDGLTVAKADDAYLEVLRLTTEMTDHYIDPFRVKLIAVSHPVAKAVMDIYHRSRGRIPPRTNGTTLGGVAVGEVYLYPPPATAAHCAES